MADSNENFSSLDPLGSGFGKIEQPSLDEQGFSAFEGDRLSSPKINFPEPRYIPILPPSTGLVSHQENVRRNVVGTAPNTKPAGKSMSPADFAKSLDSYYSAKEQTNQDANEYARIYSYNAGPAGNNFYKRYAAYGEETFNKIGFHPFRDNEAIFNESTSGWQDTKRMMVHSFWPLMKQGFVSGPKSLFKALQGDFSPDLEDAKMFEEAAAIGNSTKGGFGAFMNNAALSFGYTAGIITEALLEEAGLLLLEAATFGGATPVVAAGTAANAAKLARIPGAVSKINEIQNLTEGAHAVNSTLNAMDNVNTARKFFDASKAKSAASSIGRFFNPVEHTTDAFKAILKNEDNLTGLARAMDVTKKSFGGFYGDIKSINMALSEARLEGGMQQNEMYNELYDNFYAENGRAPSDAEQKEFIKVSKEAGMSSLMWNTALIFGSNKIVLDNIVGSRGGIKGRMQSKTAELLDLEGGKVIQKTKDITLKSTGRKFKMPELEWRKNSLWNTVKAFKDQPFKSALTGSISYFKRNITEGLQENAQEVIAQATKAYYMDAYNNPNVATHTYARGLVTNAIKDQFSAQGFQTLASGMVMGLFSSPLNAVPSAFSIGYNKIFNKEAYEKYKAARDLHGTNMVKTMSSIDLKDFLDSTIANYGMQSSAQEDRMTADEKVARDAADGAFIMQMNTVLDKGMMDYYVHNLESLTGLTAEEIEEVIPSIPKGEGAKYLERIPETIERAKRLEKKHKFYNERFPNPININSISKDDPQYEDSALTWHAWEVAKRNAVFFNESFDNTMGRMSSIMNELNTFADLQGASFNDIKVLFDQKLMQNEKEMLTSEIEGLKNSGAKASEIAKKERKLEAYDNMNEALLNFKAHFADRNKIVQRLMEQYPDMSPEQFNEIIDKQLGERTEESDNEVRDELRKAFDKYLVAISSTGDTVPFDSDIDEAFTKLVDYQLLSNESRSLAEGVNLLHDPQGFFDHVQRNKTWMKELYDNRSEYYENLKEQEFRKKEGNDLLNHLASQNLYISVEDFRRWRDENILPEEIYDDSKKIVIRRSNPLYDELIRPFQMMADVQSKRTDVEITDTAIRAELDKLEADTLARIEALDKTDTRIDEEALNFGRAKSIDYKKIMAQTSDGFYVDVTYDLNDTENKATFYRDGDVLKYDNIDGKEVSEASLKAELGATKFKTAVKYRIEAMPNQDEYDQIMQDFEEKKAEIIKRAAESKNISEEEAEAEIETPLITTDTALVDMPADLYNQIAQAFDEYTEGTDLESLVGDDYDNALESFVRSNIIAARLIDAYNGDQKLAKAMAAQPVEATMTINGKNVPLKDISEKDLQGYIKDMQIRAKDLEAKADKTLEDKTALADLIYGIRKIQEHLNDRKSEGYTSEQKATINQLDKLVEAQNDILKGPGGYVIDNEVYSRVTSVINQFQEAYSYRDETAVKATFNTTIARDGLTPESIEAFISQLKKQKLSGFSTYTYDSIRKELTDILSGNAIVRTTVKTTEIFNPSEGQIKREGNVVFGAAGKMKQSAGRINQDALFVDQENGLFVVADGMGGVNKVPFFQPHDAARLMINQFRGIKEKNPFDIVIDAYKANNQVTAQEIFKLLQNKGLIPDSAKYDDTDVVGLADPNIIAINGLLRILKDPKSISDKDSWLTRAVGAVGVKAQRVADNKYEIEHVGDAVFFIVDKNNNIRQVQGLSTSPLVDGFTWGIDSNGGTDPESARKISKYTVELKPGERLVLSSDFIETDQAIKEFIDANFGENLNFDAFRKNNKNDDASFIVIEYGAKPLEKVQTSTAGPQMSQEEVLNRVMGTISETTFEASRVTGNYIDDQIRNVFDGVTPVFNENSITKEAFEQLFGTDPANPGYVTNIKSIVDKEGLYVLSRVKLNDGTERGLVLFDKDAKIAGEVDLLAVDRSGKVYIIDVKTGQFSKWKYFDNNAKGYSKKDAYTLQQTAYANLLFNQIGKQASVSLLPIELEYDNESAQITKGGRPSAPGILAPGMYRIPLPISDDIQSKIDSVIPRKGAVAPAEVPVEVTGESEDIVTLEDENVETPPGEPIIDLDIETLKEPILQASQEVLDAFKADMAAAIAGNNISSESVMAVQELIDIRQRELNDSNTVVKLTPNNIQKDTQLVATGTIFTGKNDSDTFVTEGDAARVMSVNAAKNTVTLQSANKRQKTISFEELNKLFILKQQVMNFETVETPPAPLTKNEKNFVNESMELVNELLKNNSRKDALKKEAEGQTVDEVDAELFEDETSNC